MLIVLECFELRGDEVRLLLDLDPTWGSEKLPRPCICVTATNAFQYEMGPSAVYVSFLTLASPYAGGITSGVFFLSMFIRGSYLPGPQPL